MPIKTVLGDHFVRFGNCIFIDATNEIGGLFEDFDTVGFVETEEEFIAMALHGMQQQGGNLFYFGQEIQATEMNQTSGSSVDLIGLLLLDGHRMTIDYILNKNYHKGASNV